MVVAGATPQSPAPMDRLNRVDGSSALFEARTGMSRINTNIESLIARRAVDNVNQADTFVAVADSVLQEVSSLNSLQVARENETAAGSAILDADFAIETSRLTRARILVSSSISVLQLTNAQPRVGGSAHCDTGSAWGCDPLLPSVSFDIGSIVGP